MKLFLIFAVFVVLAVAVVESRNHLLSNAKTNRTTLAAPTPTPKPSDSASSAPDSSDGTALFSKIGKMMEDFLKKLFSAGKSVGGNSTTPEPKVEAKPKA